MKKILLLALSILLTLSAFSFEFGFGGSEINFFPKEQVINPLKDKGILLERGIITYGGSGKGRISSSPVFMGGEGSEGFSKIGDYTYKISYGAFVIGAMYEFLNIIDLEGGFGLGGYTQTISKNFSGLGKSIDDFINGTSPSNNSIIYEAYTISPYLSITIQPSEFIGFFVKAQYFAGYSENGWTFTEKNKVEGIENNLLQNYNFSAGLSFGF